MNHEENCFCLQDELCAFLKRIAINYSGNDALLLQLTQRMLNAMQEEDREKMRRFLMHNNYLLTQPQRCDTPIIRQDKRLIKAKELIEKDFCTELHLSGIAGYIGLAKETLCRLYHKHYSITITNYVNKLRINKAENLLQYSDDKISDISSQCGFNNNNYFNRVFKKLKGMTPGMYRKGH